MRDSERKYGGDVVPMVGDVVRQSGAELLMPVTHVANGLVTCRYHNPKHERAGEDGTVHEDFPESGLILVERKS